MVINHFQNKIANFFGLRIILAASNLNFIASNLNFIESNLKFIASDLNFIASNLNFIASYPNGYDSMLITAFVTQIIQFILIIRKRNI